MDMVLEYPMKMILYFVVILVLAGIMWTFRDRIASICLLPPCEELQCESKTYVQDESVLTNDVADKYCNLCWDKNQRGECKEDWVCYAVNLGSQVNPSSITLGSGVTGFCEIACNKDAKTVFFEYDSIFRKVKLTC